MKREELIAELRNDINSAELESCPFSITISAQWAIEQMEADAKLIAELESECAQYMMAVGKCVQDLHEERRINEARTLAAMEAVKEKAESVAFQFGSNTYESRMNIKSINCADILKELESKS